MYSKRQEKIIQYLSEVKFAKVEQMAELFEVSVETIRRDLLELEKDSSIKRIRGGAVFNTLRAREMEFDKKLENRQLEKISTRILPPEASSTYLIPVLTTFKQLYRYFQYNELFSFEISKELL